MSGDGKFADNSRACCHAINAYWFKRGYDMNARIELKPTIHKSRGGEVKYWHNEIVSDSLKGMPLRKIN